MSGRYDMTTDPSTWPSPDDVDVIRAQEMWEATDDYADAALEWGINDADIVAEIKDRFFATERHHTAFGLWLDRQMP